VANGAGGEIWREQVRGSYPDLRLIGLPGLERLGMYRRGKAPPPPLFHLTGGLPVRFGDGTADAEMPASGWLLNSAGLISGGTLAILADIAFGCSIETKLPAGVPYTTAELSMTFLRPAPQGGMLDAAGQTIQVGRSVALSEVFVYHRESESLLAHGTSRCAVLPALDPVPEPPGELPDVEIPGHEVPDPFRRPAPTDGVLAQEVWDELSGAEILERQLSGELPPPPIHALTGLALTGWSDGEATFVLPASEWLASPLRLVQGGATAMLADIAMLAAVQSRAPAGLAFAGLDLKVNYLRPAPADGRDLTARAEVVHSGRTLAITRARVENADGKPVALATASSMFLPGRPASLGEVELGDREAAAD
jgi:uncharacterized protein (TIGR00369 family)